jgi:hypothetical protein
MFMKAIVAMALFKGIESEFLAPALTTTVADCDVFFFLHDRGQTRAYKERQV